MSAMLEQAIIDAEQLKEAAKKTAEEAVVEKYQDEIKEAVEKILEQEDDLGGMEMAPTPEGNLEFVEDLPSAQTTPDSEIVEINLDKLEEMMAAEIEEGGLDASEMVSREEIAEELTEDEEVEIDEEALLELVDETQEIELNETDLAAAIMEMLSEEEEDTLGMPSDAEKEEASQEGSEAASAAATGKGTTAVEELEEDKAEEEAQKGKTRDKEGPGAGGGYRRHPKTTLQENLDKVDKEKKSLLKEQKRSERKVQLLKEKVDKYGTVIKQLKNKLNESNLTNAKLLYQNRILNSVSLNERQKDKIVEAISNATTVEETKIIFETLQSAVGSFIKNKAPQSLREVVSRSSSAFIPRKEVKPQTDAFSERMKRLAGLK
jgi:hypothetical protein